MPEIILFGYPTSPYYQKVILALNFLQLPYKTCSQPRMLPRPDLSSLGITYRRIPLLSIDGHLYADSSLIIHHLCRLAGVENDNATEALGQNVFPYAAMLIPYKLIADPAFLADRTKLTGRPWTEKSIVRQRPHALAQFRAYLALITRLLDSHGGTLGGNGKITMADIHVGFVVRWVLFGHGGSSPEVSNDTHPAIFAWLQRLQQDIKVQKAQQVAFADIKGKLSGDGADDGRVLAHDDADPLKLSVGATVAVTPVDTGKSHPQVGRLLALNDTEVCLRTSGGVSMSLPRINYTVGPLPSSQSKI